MSLQRAGMACLIVALALSACVASEAGGVRELQAKGTDVSQYVRVAGNRDVDNVLIAIHGGPGLTSHYMLDLEQLAGPDLAVVTYDQRGVGRSSNPPADPASYTLQKYAQDLDAVRAAMGAETVHVLGHSWGGIVALRYASLYPERVRSLILVGSGPPTWEQTKRCQAALRDRAITLVQEGVVPSNPTPGTLEAEKGYLPAYFADPSFWFSADNPGSAPEINERTEQVTNLTFQAIAGYDLTVDLAGLRARVLNLWGDSDPAGLVASETINQALASAALEPVVLTKCGHFWQECPDQFFAAVRAFLGLTGT